MPQFLIKKHLENLKINFEVITHEAFHSVEETLGAYAKMGIPENKSLFLRDEKKRRFFLVVIAGGKQADLKSLALTFKQKRLSFVSPLTLEAKLHTIPGSVSPFGLIFPQAAEIEVLFDEDLLKDEYIGFHPNLNTQTWKIKTADFKTFLDSLPQTIIFDVL